MRISINTILTPTDVKEAMRAETTLNLVTEGGQSVKFLPKTKVQFELRWSGTARGRTYFLSLVLSRITMNTYKAFLETEEP